jgi:hypothetical protein
MLPQKNKWKILGYPYLHKAGLANMLIPWADCYLWCKDNFLQMVSPNWYKFRVGPLIRNERDKRNYHRLFLPSDQITGIQKYWLLLNSRKISSQIGREVKNIEGIPGNKIVVFSNMNEFPHLIGRHKEVYSELYRITKPKFRPNEFLESDFVGIHIRLGDYPNIPKYEENNHVYYRLPITWYIECLEKIREVIGIQIKACVFSDGSEEEISPLLRLPNVIRSPFIESISDILAISRSSILITSRSSFSLFGAYLGQVPSIWYGNRKTISSLGISPGGISTSLEIEWQSGDMFPPEFIKTINNRIKLK